MQTSLSRLVITFGLLALVLAFTPLQALPVPSKTAADQPMVERDADLAALGAVLEQEEVMEVLAANGFTREEANQRLAQLSPEELSALASQTEQLQAAGQGGVPTYIWILIAVLIVVAIVAIA